MKVTFEEIDKYIRSGSVVDNNRIDLIYKSILSDPFSFLLNGGYIWKALLYSVFPSFIVFSLRDSIYMSFMNTKETSNLIFVLFSIWLLVNKNTCFMSSKIILILCAIFPSQNTVYKISGTCIPLKFSQYSFVILATLLSFTYIYLSFLG